MKKVEEFWECYPEPRDATYFKDEHGGVDIDKVFKFAEEYASQSQFQPVSVSEEEIEAISFAQFIQYGLQCSDNIVDGMPWSFEYKGHPVTHENDECYIVETEIGMKEFTPKDMLFTDLNGNIYPHEIPSHQPTKIDEGEIHRIANQYLIIDEDDNPYFTLRGAQAIAKLINGGNEG